MAEFLREKIVAKDGCKVKKTELYETFEHGIRCSIRGVPKGKELYDFMIKLIWQIQGWLHNIKINYMMNPG